MVLLLPGRRSLGRVGVYEARNHLTEEASSLKALEPNIKVPGGAAAAMPERGFEGESVHKTVLRSTKLAPNLRRRRRQGVV